MRKIIVSPGDRFDMLEVIREIEQKLQPDGSRTRQFLLKCDCGLDCVIGLASLIRTSYSCGCKRRKPKTAPRPKSRILPKIGQVFGDLTVVEVLPFKARDRTEVIVLCSCGKVKTCKHDTLRLGNTKSCGCSRTKVRGINKTHGMSGAKLYSTWSKMKSRATKKGKPGSKHYADRGIGICEEWLVFENFMVWSLANGYREGLEIERKDNNKDYCPSNAEWATHGDNMENTSRSKVWKIGDTEYPSSRKAAKACGVSVSTIRQWCYGLARDGRWTPPREDCSAYLKYPKQDVA